MKNIFGNVPAVEDVGNITHLTATVPYVQDVL
jgi:hypothetical protein